MKRPCRFCGAELLIVHNQETGKKVALDVLSRPHIFELLDACEGGDIAAPVPQQEVYVAHALTCPAIRDESKGAA